ncbi:MAG: dTMP kinase [Patescibacteria group bacterium]|nr:MAG: dTMP kinase [Patescibacteria group bacterium]
MQNKKGVFIVIDGTDGSGKKTQSELLVSHLKDEGQEVLSVTFPRYGHSSATLVEMYLGGDFGQDANAINPYVVSSFYAADRFAHKEEIIEALSMGKIVVADRYVASNMAHQGSKIEDKEQRKQYLKWLYDFEFTKAQIPKPDLNVILHVPTEISMKLVTDRGENKDIHEKDERHIKAAEETYLSIADIFDDFAVIECVKDNQIMSREDIHEMVWKKIEKMIS